MNQLSTPRRINIAALLVAAAGILVIFASARDLFPVSVPPGPIILAVAAALVAFVPGRWTPVIGVIVPLFILVGGFTSGGLANVLGENAGAIAGVAIQLSGLVTAIVSGAFATVGEPRHRAALHGGS